MLTEVAEEFRTGDLDAAWDAWIAFFAHPGRNLLESSAFHRCFLVDCPHVGVLGGILGKARAELEMLDGFCPSVVDPEMLEEAVSPEHEAGLRRMYARIVRNGLSDSCERWPSRQRSQLGEAAARFEPISETIPFAWFQAQQGCCLPTADLVIGSTPMRALMDTGSSGSQLYMTAAEAHGRTDVTLTGHTQRTIGIHDVEWGKIAVVSSFAIGRSTHHNARFDVEKERPAPLGYPDPLRAVLGMTMLLRYDAVCFAWEERRLYLGVLGPCAGGAVPFDAYLSGSLTPRATVRAESGVRFTAVIDTGAFHTNCSAAFLDANGGELNFRFGDHPALSDRCVPDQRVLYPNLQTTGEWQVALRMNALLRFRAFGWQRTPFRMFFVPRDAEAGRPSDASSA